MKFTVSEDVDINGTSLRGEVVATRKQIEAVFGKPTYRGDRYDKVTCEWDVEFEDGTVASIYDWKRYSDGSPKMSEEYEWHIGGATELAVEYVKACLSEWALV